MITYRPAWWDQGDCDAWRGPVSSRFTFFGVISFTDRVADFLADQLYELWDYSPDTWRAIS